MVRVWFMDTNDGDQRLEHHKQPPKFISVDDLYKLTGVEYFKVDHTNYDKDEILQNLRSKRNYSYEDEITCSKSCLTNYEEKLKQFFTEHLHTDEEIRLILDGSGYFDVRSRNDDWIRIEVVAGDLIILPEGIYHRFTLNMNNYIKVKRYFIGEPVWVQYTRPEADDMKCRQQYLQRLKDEFSIASA